MLQVNDCELRNHSGEEDHNSNEYQNLKCNKLPSSSTLFVKHYFSSFISSIVPVFDAFKFDKNQVDVGVKLKHGRDQAEASTCDAALDENVDYYCQERKRILIGLVLINHGNVAPNSCSTRKDCE